MPFLWEMLYESLHVPDGQEPFARAIVREPQLAKYVEGWGREGDAGFLAVGPDGQPMGSITARFYAEGNKSYGYVGSDVPELGMALLPAHRGSGIGTALLARLVEELRGRSVKRVSLSVDPRNAAAMALYRRFGFGEVRKDGTSIVMVANLDA
ncbi:GNAT family N-acetyltransferase [Paenibacillus sp. MWE-103]|uniref:GNAT family N-acetyltransferase n=1 Tax=Paenibacillus artemisiicola TaxID=1172618 RepID=A0ABS3WJF9_9BACL|nr:GNAT family N-acetyltransferase [Paenibacillus artemisiicola]MBO7748437.1 GNAT family N-acetyltransferase [Paenibacillus artemisiicola]